MFVERLKQLETDAAKISALAPKKQVAALITLQQALIALAREAFSADDLEEDGTTAYTPSAM